MQQHIITTYLFDELPEDSQQKAIEKYQDINVDYDWWDYVCADAEDNSLAKIKAFDDYSCTLELLPDVRTSCRRILKTHGKTYDTWKLAAETLRTYVHAQVSWWNNLDPEDQDYYRMSDFDGTDEHVAIEAEYVYALSKEYHIILLRGYEDLTSDENIAETLRANEYQFTLEGEIYP